MHEIATGLQFPEGPIAMDDGSILLVEIARGTLSRVHPDGRVEVVADCGGGPNGAAIGPDGAVYLCNNGGFAWRRVEGMLLPGVQSDDYVGGSIQRVDLESGSVGCRAFLLSETWRSRLRRLDWLWRGRTA